MGTRAIYFFEERLADDCYYGVYKHYDGYPQGAADFIENAKSYAWPLPRWKLMNLRRRLLRQTKTPKAVRFDCFQTLNTHQSP